MKTFELSISREALSIALSRAALCASTKPHIPVMGCVKLEQADGALRLTTTTVDLTLTLAVAAKIDECKPICLPVKRLLDIVNALPPGTVVIRGNESSTKAVVIGGKTRLELYGFPASEFPVVEKRKFDGNLGLDAAAFASIFSQIGVHCSTAASRPALCGVLLDSREDGFFLVATDGHVGARIKFAPPIQPRGSWVLPRAAAAPVTKLFATVEEPLRISVSNVAVRLSTEGVRLDVRLVDAQYPNYTPIFGQRQANKSVGAVDAALLKSAIQRVTAIGDVKLTVFKWHTDRLEIRAQSDNGIVNDEVPCRYSGEEGLAVGMTAENVSNVITTLGADDLRFYMGTPTSPVIVVDSTKDIADRDAILAPLVVRVGAEPAKIAA